MLVNKSIRGKRAALAQRTQVNSGLKQLLRNIKNGLIYKV